MKTTFLLLIALAITPPLMAGQKAPRHRAPEKNAMAGTINFSVKSADGSVKNYALEIPAAPPAAATAATGGKISQQAAVLAALGWAPGFYGSTNTAATSVDFLTEPTPYYLVHLTGKVGDSPQTLYAAVLDDGRIVRPSVTAGPMKESTSSRKTTNKAKM